MSFATESTKFYDDLFSTRPLNGWCSRYIYMQTRLPIWRWWAHSIIRLHEAWWRENVALGHCGLYKWVSAFVHYTDVIITTMASQITSLTVVYSTVYLDADQRKHQSSASLAFVWGIQRDRWIPRTKGQLRGKCFHLMTSSCIEANQCGDECVWNCDLYEIINMLPIDSFHWCGRP